MLVGVVGVGGCWQVLAGVGWQCCGSGSVESVSFPCIRIRIKKWLDPESGSVSNDTDPDPTKTIENIKNFNFLH